MREDMEAAKLFSLIADVVVERINKWMLDSG
jgi:hypothetical protein